MSMVFQIVLFVSSFQSSLIAIYLNKKLVIIMFDIEVYESINICINCKILSH